MSVRSDTTLHLNGYWPKGIGQVFPSGGRRWTSIQLVADDQTVSALGDVPPLGMVKAALEAAEGVARQATDDELAADTITRHEARRLAFRLIRHLTDTDAGTETDGLNRLAEAVRGERWPTVAEVAGEVHGSGACPGPAPPQTAHDDAPHPNCPECGKEAAMHAVAPSCGYSGCTPAEPCGACQSLAGATGGEAR